MTFYYCFSSKRNTFFTTDSYLFGTEGLLQSNSNESVKRHSTAYLLDSLRLVETDKTFKPIYKLSRYEYAIQFMERLSTYPALDGLREINSYQYLFRMAYKAYDYDKYARAYLHGSSDYFDFKLKTDQDLSFEREYPHLV